MQPFNIALIMRVGCFLVRQGCLTAHDQGGIPAHNPALCYLVALKPPSKGVGGVKLSDNQAAFLPVCCCA